MQRIKDNIQSKFSDLSKRIKRPPSKGQSLIELALVLPIMILMLLGIAEISLFMGRYLDLLDLTREAAREASRDDPFALEAGVLPANVTTLTGDKICQGGNSSAGVNFYYKAACLFSPPYPTSGVTTDVCQDANFCNGFNRYVNFDITRDDVVISAYTIANPTNDPAGSTIQQTWPKTTGTHDPWWALSTDGPFVGNTYTNTDNQSVTAAKENWKKDCKGNPSGATAPYYTAATIGPLLNNNFGAPANRGYVAVEVYYCYHQILGIPVFTNFVPNPMRIHAYTLMPLPNAQPTPVP